MMKPLLNWISGIFLAATWVAFALTALATPSAQAQTYTKTILHDYAGQLDGETPSTRLMLDKAGNLYGVAQSGGTYNLGTIFKVDTGGLYTVLYSFGADARSAVILIRAGILPHASHPLHLSAGSVAVDGNTHPNGKQPERDLQLQEAVASVGNG
jgi:uncharacterized repeat protein (TIGR03803 family)